MPTLSEGTHLKGLACCLSLLLLWRIPELGVIQGRSGLPADFIPVQYLRPVAQDVYHLHRLRL